MIWFKHDTSASNDAKIKKIIINHGVAGYAVYFHCLELIAGNISESNINFELEHDAEIIADNLKIKGTSDKSGVEIVENIMRDLIKNGLFEERGGHIFCFKLLKRLDLSMTSNQKLRQLITSAKGYHDKVMINPDKVMQEENRIEEIRIDEKRRDIRADESASPSKKFVIPTVDEIYSQMFKVGIETASEESLKFFNYYESCGWRVGNKPMKNWRAAVNTWKSNLDKYKPHNKQSGYKRPGLLNLSDKEDQKKLIDGLQEARKIYGNN